MGKADKRPQPFEWLSRRFIFLRCHQKAASIEAARFMPTSSLVEDLYENLEMWIPFLRMREEGAEVLVIGTSGFETYTSKHGYPVSVNLAA
jgi:putative intracellular protease/amidase